MRILEEKVIFFKENISKVDEAIIIRLDENFNMEYAHQSTAIEGNTLTLNDIYLINGGTSVGGKTLREVTEVSNHLKMFKYIKQKVDEQVALGSELVKDIHQILMNNIIHGGIYRSVNVYITGAKFEPPEPYIMRDDLEYFYYKLNEDKFDNIFHKSAYTHAEFVRIHPFIDGNGRTSRALMNYQLMSDGLLPININVGEREKYIESLSQYTENENLQPFIDFIKEKEEEELDRYIKIIEQSISLQFIDN